VTRRAQVSSERGSWPRSAGLVDRSQAHVRDNAVGGKAERATYLGFVTARVEHSGKTTAWAGPHGERCSGTRSLRPCAKPRVEALRLTETPLVEQLAFRPSPQLRPPEIKLVLALATAHRAPSAPRANQRSEPVSTRQASRSGTGSSSENALASSHPQSTSARPREPLAGVLTGGCVGGAERSRCACSAAGAPAHPEARAICEQITSRVAGWRRAVSREAECGKTEWRK
jgi:hypothetical protein